MADAKKCDRCGNLYEKYEGLKLDYKGVRDIRWDRMCFVSKDNFHKYFDLCPDCMAALISFIKQGEKQC